MVVLVTGAAGQLGRALQHQAFGYPGLTFVFCDAQMLDITNKAQTESVFSHYRPAYCINTAAFTRVDDAESEPGKAHLVNSTGVRNLAVVCRDFDVTLVHLSTDFVFDGNAEIPYQESCPTHPSGVYGQTKLEGEDAIRETMTRYFIIRTSWVYSDFGHNFKQTILRLAGERDAISVVDDQIGSPTHALDLAEALLEMIVQSMHWTSDTRFGTYHFSNEGQCSWYEFARAIVDAYKSPVSILPIKTSQYPTKAKRPQYSVLDKSKIKRTFGLAISSWQESLKKHA
ncbi:dTDP-4-dehydrorhamnose reductase [Flavobacterium caeni]|uniref:dTDP-4-dehydrorhamnose reductase n=1 Tax=Flavobacterium caeni TaxID=490189 RepID=A0A1G5JCS5_9FLAO|nr:dTDP-4-dehydrorhamnose reductase [Flavobacterium caeni]SCY85518.1 dTDP-4-dehydrorhamnose reductase [Flavobacterium caeni]